MAMTRGYGASARIAGDRSMAGTFRGGLILLFVLCLCGVVLGGAILRIDDDTLRSIGPAMTVIMFRDQDLPWFALCLVMVVYVGRTMNRPLSEWIASLVERYVPAQPRPRRHVILMALAVLIVAGIGSFLIIHAADKSADEYVATFQATIFQEGLLLASPDDEWAHLAEPLHPIFAFRDPANNLWGSDYRPVFAAVRAAFEFVGLGPATNAVFAALSVLFVAAVARQLWPDNREAPIVAAALLATSPQFLITGMTGFAWSAHLCLNLLWLWLFLRDDGIGHVLAVLVGITAAGLHQVHVHAFFVLPFMLALLKDRRWRLAAFYAVLYGVGHAFWIFWHDISVMVTVGGDGAAATTDIGVEQLSRGLSLVELFNPAGLALMVVNLLRLVGWLNLLFVPLIYVALRPWSGAPRFARLLVWSCLVSLLLYVLLMPNQTYGLGYRYLHAHLGNLTLLATLGWVRLCADDAGQLRQSVLRAFGYSAALMVLIGLPMRALQMERFVYPTAASVRHIQAIDSDVVLVDHSGIWYGRELVRNDPFLRNRPKIIGLQSLTPEQVETLCADYSVTVVDYYDFAEYGAVPVRDNLAGERDISGIDRELRAIATSPRCSRN